MQIGVLSVSQQQRTTRQASVFQFNAMGPLMSDSGSAASSVSQPVYTKTSLSLSLCTDQAHTPLPLTASKLVNFFASLQKSDLLSLVAQSVSSWQHYQ